MKLKHGHSHLVLAALVVAGCAPAPEEAPPTVTGRVRRQELRINADAGVAVAPSTDATEFTKLVAQRSGKLGPSRQDPFALRPVEKQYDLVQSVERLAGTEGGFPLFYEAKVNVIEVPEIEPQPYRRLSGIVVGDTVLVIVELGPGNTQIVGPGQRIPTTEWTVASIDSEKAILRRGGNKLPKEIRVRLESPPAGLGPDFGGDGGNPGGPPGGSPGGAGNPGRPDGGGDDGER